MTGALSGSPRPSIELDVRTAGRLSLHDGTRSWTATKWLRLIPLGAPPLAIRL